MTQEGYNDYVHTVYGYKNGTANSYIMAIHIIDEMFGFDDVFELKGQSIACIDDTELLLNICEFICKQQSMFNKSLDSIFRNISDRQKSYPSKGFCSAAVKQLIKYHEYDLKQQKATSFVSSLKKGTEVSGKLIELFQIDKEGGDVVVTTRARLGQSYFRKMVMANFDNKCCVTGLNVPQILRASHIVAWADDKRHRMDPENGLCLSATYDAAFDQHLITFDEKYRMVVSEYIQHFYTNATAKEYFDSYEGKVITMPKLYLPNKKLLEKHRNLLVG